jgi:hypothetical protein
VLLSKPRSGCVFALNLFQIFWCYSYASAFYVYPWALVPKVNHLEAVCLWRKCKKGKSLVPPLKARSLSQSWLGLVECPLSPEREIFPSVNISMIHCEV